MVCIKAASDLRRHKDEALADDTSTHIRAFLQAVRALIGDRLAAVTTELDDHITDRLPVTPAPEGRCVEREVLWPGKMLRSRLAGYLSAVEELAVPLETLHRSCAAVELVHTASLCHDDVIDRAVLRRGRPALWQTDGPSGAVLTGDLILCEAIELMMNTEGGRHLPGLLNKIREVVIAEIDQEIVLRGKEVPVEASANLARRKTGSLFAFLSGLCGDGDPALVKVLTESGYSLGAAYQLADDLADVHGDEQELGKTLGTDARRRKTTLAQKGAEGRRQIHAILRRECHRAIQATKAWPGVQAALALYVTEELRPAMRQFDSEVQVDVSL